MYCTGQHGSRGRCCPFSLAREKDEIGWWGQTLPRVEVWARRCKQREGRNASLPNWTQSHRHARRSICGTSRHWPLQLAQQRPLTTGCSGWKQTQAPGGKRRQQHSSTSPMRRLHGEARSQTAARNKLTHVDGHVKLPAVPKERYF